MSIHVNKKLTVVILILVCSIAVITFVILHNRDKPKFEYEGGINCMPVLDRKQAELCRQAKEANYPDIAE